METPPTVTVISDTGATTIAGATRRAPSRNGSDFTYLSAAYADVGTVGSYTNCYRQTGLTIAQAAGQIGNLLRFEFESDTDQLEILVRSEDSTHSKYRIWVDGELATATESSVIGSATAWRRIKIVFATAANRRITFEGQEMTFGGIWALPTRTLWPTSRDVGPRVIVMGDSYGTSFDTDVKWVWDSFAVVAGRLLNWDVFPSFVSGTGYLQDGFGTGEANYGARFATDVTALSPDIVVFTGGLNDNGYSPLTLVQTAITSLFSAAKAALPATRFLVLSPFRPTDTYYTSLNTIAGYLYAQALANGFTFVGQPIEYIQGTGTVAAPTGVGNSDFYTLADTYHLNPAGYELLGRRLAAEIQDSTRDWWATDRLVTMDAAKRGLVPAPAASPSASKYLTETGTWATVAGAGTTITAVRAYRSAGLAAQTGLVQIGYNTQSYIDVAGYHSTATNNARFKAPAAGRYRLTAQVALSAMGNHGAIVGIDKNDDTNFLYQTLLDAVRAGDLANQIVAQVTTGWINLAENDYVAVSVYSDDPSYDVGSTNTWAVFERAA
jgi:lysophospholipase L1-like esterase